MQPIDALTLKHLAAELDLKLADGKINKIQQANHNEVLLHLWVGGEASRQKLYINVHPQYAFCVLVKDTPFLTFPEKAPNFCMVLRKHLTSARIKQVKTLPDERVLNIHMENYNELGQQVQLVLSLELMGKHSNIILYDEELQTIIGCAHGVSEQMSSQREISVGYPYAPPPKPKQPPLSQAFQLEVSAVMRQALQQGLSPVDALTCHFSGMGKAILGDILENEPTPERCYNILMELMQGIHLYPAIRADLGRFSLYPGYEGRADWEACGTVNRMIQQFFVGHLALDKLKNIKHQLMQVLKNQEKKFQKRMKELEKTDEEALQRLRKFGDLLTIAVSENRKPQGHIIELEDYETMQPVKVELDINLSLSENAQLYYRRYKKGQARARMAEEQSQQLNSQLAFIQELASAIEMATSPDELASIREDLEAQGWMQPLETRKKGKQQKPSQPLSVISSDGMTILIGRNGLQNDQLVGKLAHPEDVWLHAHLIPGSHVLVKTDKREMPDQTLLEAALLAAWFSKARHSVNVPIVYTKARYVRKIPNSYPGHVNYVSEKSVNVTPGADEIERLLQPKQHPATA